jgi:hypothetical protein
MGFSLQDGAGRYAACIVPVNHFNLVQGGQYRQKGFLQRAIAAHSIPYSSLSDVTASFAAAAHGLRMAAHWPPLSVSTG